MKKSNLKFVPVAVVAAALAACGGSSGSDPVAPTTATLQGTVNDGAITGATVFLDLNNNQTQDSGEPHDVSIAGGKFSLDISGLTAAQVKASHIVTIVPVTAKDDDDIGGKTLAEAGKQAFTMMAPAVAYANADGTATGAVVSPITTLLSHDMLSDGSKSLAAATAAVQARLGLLSTDKLTQDPTKIPALKERAQVIAAAIGLVKASVQASGSGISDRDALQAALIYLQQNVTDLIYAAAEKTAAGATPVAAVQTLLAGGSGSATSSTGAGALTPATTTLLTAAQQTTESAANNITEMFAAGGSYSGNCLLEDMATCGSPNYSKLAGSATTWASGDYVLVNGTWSVRPMGNSYLLKAAGWVTNNQSASGVWTPDGLGGIASMSSGRQIRITSRMQDVSNLKFSAISGYAGPAAFANSLFPAGSRAYYMTNTEMADLYQLYVDFAPGTYNGGPGFTTLGALVDSAQTPAAGATTAHPIGSNGLNFTFNETSAVAMDAGGGTIRLFTCSLGVAAAINGGCSGGRWIAGSSASYKLSVQQGQDVLRIKASYGDAGMNLIFGIANGKVLGGEVRPTGAWAGASLKFNRVAFEAILKAGSKPTTLN